jgi:hypothetical protein
MASHGRAVILLLGLATLFILGTLLFSFFLLMGEPAPVKRVAVEPEYVLVSDTPQIPLIYDASNDPYPSTMYPEKRRSRSSKSSVNLEDGLVMHLTFDEGDGERFGDSSGKGNDASCNGSACPGSVAGVQGNGLLFDGNNDFLSVDDDSSYHSSRALSIALWMKWESTPSSVNSFVWKSEGLDCPDLPYCSNREYLFGVWNRSFVHLASTPSDLVGVRHVPLSARDDSLVENRWYHVVGVIDSDDEIMKIYINGANVAEIRDQNLSSGIRDTTGDLIIGNDFGASGATGPFKGVMDDLRIYNRALSEEEIRILAE